MVAVASVGAVAVAPAVETVFHDAPSGLDPTVILAERAVRLHKGRLVRFVTHPTSRSSPWIAASASGPLSQKGTPRASR